MKQKMIGLTGPSGAGKTEVARLLKNQGFLVLDADAIYKTRVLPDPGYKSELVGLFSEGILNGAGEIDTKSLGNIVFSDPEKLALLNRAAHKRVWDEIQRIMGFYPGESAFVLDAPQLFESGISEGCCFILSVLAPEKIRVERIMRRDGISEAAAKKRLSSQLSEEYFLRHSDEVVINDGDFDKLRAAVLRAAGKINQKIAGETD